ncbi:hypothetical protein THRCLA_20576 [Thraustotheca clavata]|uniref:DNA/RNA non-specific endonuclease domain-containing protein n=1 Tax=Thraustotheca clavata TaxID=74557 RepID=A0A1W0A5P0_9STRA|nr:hypothetical protein THRCLA_20576 [Thraustotheca clavata]
MSCQYSSQHLNCHFANFIFQLSACGHTFYALSIIKLIAADTVLRYQGFDLTYDCVNGEVDRWSLGYDNGSTNHPKSFYKDSTLPSECKQQKSTKAYGHGYDCRHLVASITWTRSVPLTKEYGLKLKLLKIANVINTSNYYHHSNCGVVYSDATNDIFLDQWGVKFLVESSANQRRNYCFVNDIEKQLNDNLVLIPVPEELKDVKASESWSLPKNCDRVDRLVYIS